MKTITGRGRGSKELTELNEGNEGRRRSPSFFSSLSSFPFVQTARRPALPKRATAKPRLERLEDRSLLTAGMLDPTFGDGGTLLMPASLRAAQAVAIQPDGKTVVAGYEWQPVDRTVSLAMHRYETDGSLDNSFGSSGVVKINTGVASTGAGANGTDGDPADIAIQSDGRIVIAYGVAVARLNVNGSLDSTFDAYGIWEANKFGTPNSPTLRSVTIQPDGKIVVAGEYDNRNSNGGSDIDFAVARLDSEGGLDNSFGDGGKTTVAFPVGISNDDHGRSVALQSDGKIIVSGYRLYEGESDSGLFEFARLNTDGSLDSTPAGSGLFQFEGLAQADGDLVARALALQPDDTILLAGSTNNGIEVVRIQLIGGGAYLQSAVIGRPTGSLQHFDSKYSPDLVLQADGKILVLGAISGEREDGAIDNARFTVTRLNSDLTCDTTFGLEGFQTIDFVSPSLDSGINDFPQSLAVQPDGRIVVVGSSFQNDAIFGAIARLTSNGVFDAPFSDPDADGIANSVDLQPGVYSSDFSDVANGGATTGTIVSRGQQVIFVQDEPSPDGLRITAHPLGGGLPASVSIDNGAAVLSLSAGDEVVATHGSVILRVVKGSVDATFTSNSGQIVVTASLPAGVGLTFKPDTAVFIAAATNSEPVDIVLANGTVQTVDPGQTLNVGTRTVAVDIVPESINVDSNGTLTVLIYGSADFDVSRTTVSSVRFAGAAPWQSTLVDGNHDGQLDLQLKFHMQDIHDALLSTYSDWLEATYTGGSSSTRDAALLQVTGEMKDQSLFEGSDTATLFLAGKSLKELLAGLFG